MSSGLPSHQSFELKVVPIRPLVSRDQRLKIYGPADAAAIWADEIATAPEYEPTVEWLAAMFLDASRGLIGFRTIAKGGGNCVYAGVKDVFVSACLAGAEMVIVAHNHPHGDSAPSDADINCAQRLLLASGLFEVALDDFLVIGLPSSHDPLAFTSLRELGKLEKIDVAALSPPSVLGPSEDFVEFCLFTNLLSQEPELRTGVVALAKAAGLAPGAWVKEFLFTELRNQFLHAGLLGTAPGAAVARSAGGPSNDEPTAPTNAS